MWTRALITAGCAVALALAPTTVRGDDDDDPREWRKKQREYMHKQYEEERKFIEEQRKLEREHIKKQREHLRKRLENDDGWDDNGRFYRGSHRQGRRFRFDDDRWFPEYEGREYPYQWDGDFYEGYHSPRRSYRYYGPTRTSRRYVAPRVIVERRPEGFVIWW